MWQIVASLMVLVGSAPVFAEEIHVLETLQPLVGQTVAHLDEVPTDRREVLEQAVELVVDQLRQRGQVELNFICTHNSRRSHLGQVWAQVAADYYGVEGVQTYSGGTEATACNIRTVRAMQRAGLQIVTATAGSNPQYLVQYAENRRPMETFSKVYDAEGNPQRDYIAMMCCADVDKRCPVVRGAIARVPLHYVDPKASDGTAEEAATYNERTRQIASEMFYLFSQVAQRLPRE